MISLALELPKKTHNRDTDPKNALRTDASGSVIKALVASSKCGMSSMRATSYKPWKEVSGPHSFSDKAGSRPSALIAWTMSSTRDEASANGARQDA